LYPTSPKVPDLLGELAVCIQLDHFIATANAAAVDEDVWDSLASGTLCQKVLKLAAKGRWRVVVGIRDRLV
jgi:hypothetical protein